MLFVRVETWWTSTGGCLWWQRWSEPYEVPHGYMWFADGEFTDWLMGRHELAGGLAEWSQGRMRYVGDVFDVEWLDDESPQHARDHLFGLHPL